MGNESLFPSLWENLPHPGKGGPGASATTVIQLDESHWRKIVGKHVCNRSEPWAEVVLAADLAIIRASPQGPFDEPPLRESTVRMLHWLAQQISASLDRPLVLLYDCLRSDRHPAQLSHRWLLVTPSGASAVIWGKESGNSLRTCYFTGGMAVESRNDRWREAIRQNVQEYAQYDPSIKKYVLPPSTHWVEKGVPPEHRSHMRFVTPASWGFQSDAFKSPWKPMGSGIWTGESGDRRSGPVDAPARATVDPGGSMEEISDA